MLSLFLTFVTMKRNVDVKKLKGGKGVVKVHTTAMCCLSIGSSLGARDQEMIQVSEDSHVNKKM